MTRERQVDKVKVCSEPDFFPSGHRQAGLWTWQTPLPIGGSHTGTGYYVYVLPGTQTHWTLSLRQKLSTFVQGNPCLMPLSSLLWVFLAFTFSGRDASKHGCMRSGWKDCTQAHGASQGLGRKGGLEKSILLMISTWVFFGSQISLIPKLFCSLLQLGFLIFPPQDLGWRRKLFKTSQTHPVN